MASEVLARLGANGHRIRAEVMRFIQQGEAETEAAEATGEQAVVRLPRDVRLVGSPAQLAQVMRRLDRIDGRLAAIERHLGIAEPGPRQEPGPPGEPGAPGETGPQAG